MRTEKAFQDIQLIEKVLAMTHRRVDPHMFHLIIWGVIMCIWYPMVNYDALTHQNFSIPLMIFFVGIGSIAGFIFEWRISVKPRIIAGNVKFSMRIGAIAWIFSGFGVLLSILIPQLYSNTIATQILIPAWGGLYTLMLMTWGVFYSREFLWCGFIPLLGTIAALIWPPFAGFILGPTMGVGVLIPGIIAELRVAKMRRDELHEKISTF